MMSTHRQIPYQDLHIVDTGDVEYIIMDSPKKRGNASTASNLVTIVTSVKMSELEEYVTKQVMQRDNQSVPITCQMTQSASKVQMTHYQTFSLANCLGMAMISPHQRRCIDTMEFLAALHTNSCTPINDAMVPLPAMHTHFYKRIYNLAL
jgi:hypothetical protein